MTQLPQFSAWLARDTDALFASGTSTTPRILLLTQVFPPHSEIGAARWEGFAPYLVEAGWGMDVVIEDPQDLGHPDWERFRQLPADIRVATCRRRRPRWYEILRRIRRTTPITSLSDSSATPATSVSESSGARDIIRRSVTATIRARQSHQLVSEFSHTGGRIVDERHQLVVSSGPAHYVHVAAARLARDRSLPHVIDLRDPWARVVPATTLERILPDEELRRFESRTLGRAALIITNTNAAGEVLQRRFPELHNRIRSIPNGSDIAPILERPSPPSIFQIAHCGSLYIDRDPRPFLKAVGRVCSRLQLDATNLRIVFMGEPARINGRTLSELASEAGIGDLFEERPLGSRDEARQLLRESLMAVAFQGATRTQVPGKVFEYAAFPLWLLALVGADSATADMLEGSEAILLDIDDVDSTERVIEACYLRYREGVLPRPVGHDGRFSRAKQAKLLIEELRRLVA